MQPPQHSIDATPTYIAPDDPAWDAERINDEVPRSEGHPYRVYYEGKTRYDLDAPVRWKLIEQCKCDGTDCERCRGKGYVEHERTNSLREYLVDGEDPDLYIMRRLRTEDWSSAKSRFAAECRKDPDDADFFGLTFFCAKRGMMKIIRGGEVVYDWGETRRPVPDRLMREMVDASEQYNLVEEIGTAVWNASQEPTEAEKKA